MKRRDVLRVLFLVAPPPTAPEDEYEDLYDELRIGWCSVDGGEFKTVMFLEMPDEEEE